MSLKSKHTNWSILRSLLFPFYSPSGSKGSTTIPSETCISPWRPCKFIFIRYPSMYLPTPPVLFFVLVLCIKLSNKILLILPDPEDRLKDTWVFQSPTQIEPSPRIVKLKYLLVCLRDDRKDGWIMCVFVRCVLSTHLWILCRHLYLCDLPVCRSSQSLLPVLSCRLSVLLLILHFVSRTFGSVLPDSSSFFLTRNNEISRKYH